MLIQIVVQQANLVYLVHVNVCLHYVVAWLKDGTAHRLTVGKIGLVDNKIVVVLGQVIDGQYLNQIGVDHLNNLLGKNTFSPSIDQWTCFIIIRTLYMVP